MSKDAIGAIIGALLLIAVVAGVTFGIQGRYDASVARTNLAAEKDTVRVYRDSTNTLTTAAAVMQFQLPSFNVTDSLSKLQTALGIATRELELTNKALTRAEVSFDAVQASLEQLVEMNVFSPTGREERLSAFVLDEELVEGEIVVVIPADTALPVEIETRLLPKPFDLTYALGCTPEKEAVATFETPAGIVAVPKKGQVDPVICHGSRPSLFSAGLTITPGGFLVGGAVATVIMLVLTGI